MTVRLLCVGVSHKTAPVALRERLAFDADAARSALERLRERHADGEFAILSTCNRSELYVARPFHGRPREAELRAFFGEFHGVSRRDYEDSLYVHADTQAVRHLFTVAAGLDSLVPGEEQILAQVKQAHRLARGVGSARSALDEVFQAALNVAKRVRTETRISAGKVSVASVAVELAQEVLGTLRGRCVLSIGAGKMNALMLRGLRRLGAGAILVANRSPGRAAELAEEFGGQAVGFESLGEALARADVVVCSTGASDPIITPVGARAALQARSAARPDAAEMLIIDIAVPRDVHPEVARLEGVRVVNIDDLQAVVERNLAARAREMDAARELIDRCVAEHFHRLHVREVAPAVEMLYRRMRQVADEELAAARNRLTGRADEDERLMRHAFHRALRRVLHTPVTRLREGAGTEVARQQAAALRRLFGLDDDPPP